MTSFTTTIGNTGVSGSTVIGNQPGEDQVLLDPAIAGTVVGIVRYTTTGQAAGVTGGLNITQFVAPGVMGSLLWVNDGVSNLSGGDTIIAWFEGALLTPADIVLGVSDLPA